MVILSAIELLIDCVNIMKSKSLNIQAKVANDRYPDDILLLCFR